MANSCGPQPSSEMKFATGVLSNPLTSYDFLPRPIPHWYIRGQVVLSSSMRIILENSQLVLTMCPAFSGTDTPYSPKPYELLLLLCPLTDTQMEARPHDRKRCSREDGWCHHTWQDTSSQMQSRDARDQSVHDLGFQTQSARSRVPQGLRHTWKTAQRSSDKTTRIGRMISVLGVGMGPQRKGARDRE